MKAVLVFIGFMSTLTSLLFAVGALAMIAVADTASPYYIPDNGAPLPLLDFVVLLSMAAMAVFLFVACGVAPHDKVRGRLVAAGIIMAVEFLWSWATPNTGGGFPVTPVTIGMVLLHVAAAVFVAYVAFLAAAQK